MRTGTAIVSVTAGVLMTLLASGYPVWADCEDGPVFPETIIAEDKNTFHWPTPLDVDFAKGDISQLSDYTIWTRGKLTATNQLDVTDDNVGPGYGVFYLVKTTGPPCGSWQTAADAEVQRDTDIPPNCSDTSLSEQQVQEAVDAGFAVAPQAWGDPDDAQLFFQTVQSELQCALEIPVSTESETAATATGFLPYDPNKFYCGVYLTGETSGPIVGILPTSQCMNMSCYNHDFDYYTNCVGGICAFSIQTSSWDNTLALSCQNAPAGCLQLTSPYYWWDLLTCGYIGNAIASPLNDPFCINPPCSGPGEDCCATTSECFYEAPVSRWPGEGDATDAVGTNHGALVGDTTFVSGVIGQAFSFDGDGDYVDFGDVLNEITVPFTVEGWIKTPGSPGGDQGWLGIFASDDSSYTENYHGFWLQLDPDNRLYVSYGDGSGNAAGARRTKGTAAPIPLNTWIHIATVVRGPTDMSIYIYGIDVGGSYSGSGGTMDHTSHPARLGANISWAPFWGLENWPFDGEIDEFAIYNRELSQNEIQAIVGDGHQETCPAQ